MHEVEGRRVFNPFYRVFLEGPDRARWQRPDEVIAALGLPAGAVVADVGAGTGYFAVRFAHAVGPNGRVLATDVQDAMLEALAERKRREDLAQLEVVRARFDDPSLPPACCDVVFLANVYKEIEDRVAYARKLAPALRPGGRVVIVDYRPGAPGFGPPEDVRLAQDRVEGELADAGFAAVARHDFLPRQYFLEFAPLRERAGVVSADPEGRLFFSSAAPNLTPGTRIALAAAPAPALRVLRRLGDAPQAAGAPLVLVRGAEAASYAVLAETPLPADALPAVGVAGETALPLGSSRCTSAEGIHLSLAAGRPPARARVWSAYLYLGYDVEPSCAEGEWAE
jgi:SAM-dependent methyltransferase